ncbi:RHS repeat-associated core domain-containing protein [Streptomyces sp. NPDC007346]|uniref:RHS repeat-associated core domain-containing protein n=1 Tax=Streptomyces sp. NPDC007346 TaxID=3154682 RepID=UPI003453EFAF
MNDVVRPLFSDSPPEKPVPRRRVTPRGGLSLAVSAVLLGTLLQGVTATPADAKGADRPPVSQAEKPVKGREGVKSEPRTLPKEPRTPESPPRASWPKPGTSVVTLTEASGGTAGAPVKAKGLAPALTAPRDGEGAKAAVPAARGEVTARIADRKQAEQAGVDGVLITLDAGGEKAGKVGVKLDYAPFAEAYGGGYASRLTLVELPACALTTPRKAACRTSSPVPTVNDTEAQTLTADAVTLKSATPTLLAAVAEEQSENGDYKATPLSPSASWQTNLNTGDFGWSYDIPVPDVPGELTPTVGLSYSSGAIDGRTGATNNQSSWVGDGFDLWPGSIERSYKPCAQDGVKNADGSKPGDLCWAYDNAFITFNGKGGELVPAGDDEFRFKDDDGSRISRLRSTERGNGDNDGEYWLLTDPHGVRYYYGYNRLPGWTEGKETTDSTWTVPVFGNNSGEPCNKATFAESWCQQAWRWNLDYVVDPHGNAVAYYYDKETNSYGRNLKAKDNTPYTRGGYLDRVEYGLKSSAMYGVKAPAKVVFTNAERCLVDSRTDCSSIDKDAFHWYDTPWDLNCTSGDECDKGRLSPVFFTRKRLTGITTHVLSGDAYAKVDSYKLDHRWGKADVDYQLLLDSVQRTGHDASTSITLPKTTFSYTQLANRLDRIGDGYAPFIKSRLSTVADESGGQIDVNYSAPACTWDALPTPETNTTRCFPQYIGGSDSADPERQWFNKYVVDSTTQTDRTGGAPDQVTLYEYLGDAAWHYADDDGLTKEKFKTWSQWRGYGHVRVKSGGQGGAAALRSQVDSYFLRGMHGDRKTPSGGTKSVSVTLGSGEGDPITDHEASTGFLYRTEVYDKVGGKVLNRTVNRPWHHETAKKVRSWGTVTANFTGTATTKTWTSLDNGAGAAWRTTSVANTYDTVAGRVTRVDDLGDSATAADDRCTRTTYATNTDKNILLLPSRVETVAVKCDTSPDRAEHVISDTRTGYDGGGYGTAPTKGDETTVATLKEHDGAKAVYLESGTAFDGYGRPLEAVDLTADVTVTGDGAPVRTVRTDGLKSSTSYTPATGIPTRITETTPPVTKGNNATAQTTVTELEPLRGQPSVVIDPNGRRTELTYDALGRSHEVWLADRRPGQTPNYAFTYFVEEGRPVAVRSRTLDNNGGQIAAYTLYDGFLRERQTQAPGPDGGRILTDVFYDERGLAAKTFDPYYTEGAPGRTLFTPDDALSVESQTRHVYDGLGRETEGRQIAGNGDGGTVLGVTRTIYGGDRTTVIPPEGGTATTTVTDARGQVTEVRQHHSRDAAAAYDATVYRYTPSGALAEVKDPADNTWSYTYDQQGRQIQADDPDKGVTDTTYDDRGRPLTTTDSRGTTLAHVHDALGRRTELRENTSTGTLRARWTYDTVSGAKGHLAESVRYVDGVAYTSRVTQYDHLYRPIRTAVVIPEAEGALAGTYQTGTSYKPSGLVAGVSYSAAGSLPGGSYNYTFEDQTLRPVSVFGDGVRAQATYSLTGKPLQYELSAGTGGKKTWATNTYEWGTQRLATSRVEREEVPGVDQHNTYRYDEVGNVLGVSDVSRDGTDTQCFAYDHLRQLTEAWAQGARSCATAPAAGPLGGVAPYHRSYTYDKTGNRLTETLHDTGGDRSKDTERTYTYPEAGRPQPHTLTSVTESGPAGTTTGAYGYDETGNTTTRPAGGATQTMSWDAEGRLAQVTESGTGGTARTTDYLYDSEGERLIKRTGGETTLYLGHTEITLTEGAAKGKATRYVPLGGGHQAVVGDDGSVTFTLADHLGTGQLAIGAADQQLTQRRTLPFGGTRGEQPTSWPGTKGFVGGTDETADTGLTHLGAREYDPDTGRFLSVDPLFNSTDPMQINGFAYSHSNPVTRSDPSGLYDPDERDYCNSHPENCRGGRYVGKNKGNGKPASNAKSKQYASVDQAQRAQNTNSGVAAKMRKDRYKQIISGGKFSFGKFYKTVKSVNDRSCRAEPGGRGGCRFANWMMERNLQKLLHDTLKRIDESWGSKNKKGGFGFDDDEFEMALSLAREGHQVVARGSDDGAPGAKGNKSFDAWVDGVRTEFKSLSTTSRKGITREIRSADEQGADFAYIRLEKADRRMAESAVNSIKRSKQAPVGLTTIRVYGDGYDFTVRLR